MNQSPNDGRVVELQSEYGRKFSLEKNKSFLKSQKKEGVDNDQFEISTKMRFDDPLPEP